MEQLLAVTLSYKQPYFSINSENEKNQTKTTTAEREYLQEHVVRGQERMAPN